MLRQVRSFLRSRLVDPRIEPTLVALEGVIAQIEGHAEAHDVHARPPCTRTARLPVVSGAEPDGSTPVDTNARAAAGAVGGTPDVSVLPAA